MKGIKVLTFVDCDEEEINFGISEFIAFLRNEGRVVVDVKTCVVSTKYERIVETFFVTIIHENEVDL